jgi:hypothetical protein
MPPLINSIRNSVSWGGEAHHGFVSCLSCFQAMRLACLYVGATYTADRTGPQAARISSMHARNVFPERRPAASTRKRLLDMKTDDCGGFSEMIILVV